MEQKAKKADSDCLFDCRHAADLPFRSLRLVSRSFKDWVDSFVGGENVVKIRLKRIGKKKAPFYRIVVADSRYARDGRFLEEIGHYNPNTNPSEIEVDADRAKDWLNKGAQPTDTVRALLKKNGIL